MTGAVFHALLSHWRRAPLQLFTLIAGLALATGLWSGVQAINAEARASYDAAAATLGEGRYARIEAASGGEIALADYVALRRAGWQVSPVVQGRLGKVRLVGIERVDHVDLDRIARQIGVAQHRALGRAGGPAGILQQSEIVGGKVGKSAGIAAQPVTPLADIGPRGH